LKIKTPYIYLSAIVVIILGLVFYSQIEKSPAEGNQVSEQMPDDEVHRNLKKQHDQFGLKEEAKKMLEEYEKSLKENPNDTAKMREYADFLAMAHKIDEAQKYYEKILSMDKKRKDIMINLSTIFYNKGELDKAAQLTNDILKIDKNDLSAIYNLGVIEATRGNYDKAKKHWEKIVNEFPNSDLAPLASKSLGRLEEMNQKQ
jgi:tetratricopeptide (TPR) repeat protein